MKAQNSPFSFPSTLPSKSISKVRVTSDGGLILVRELDERLEFGELIQQHLTDSRRGKNTQFPFADLLRQSVYSRIAQLSQLARFVAAKSFGISERYPKVFATAKAGVATCSGGGGRIGDTMIRGAGWEGRLRWR